MCNTPGAHAHKTIGTSCTIILHATGRLSKLINLLDLGVNNWLTLFRFFYFQAYLYRRNDTCWYLELSILFIVHKSRNWGTELWIKTMSKRSSYCVRNFLLNFLRLFYVLFTLTALFIFNLCWRYFAII